MSSSVTVLSERSKQRKEVETMRKNADKLGTLLKGYSNLVYKEHLESLMDESQDDNAFAPTYLLYATDVIDPPSGISDPTGNRRIVFGLQTSSLVKELPICDTMADLNQTQVSELDALQRRERPGPRYKTAIDWRRGSAGILALAAMSYAAPNAFIAREMSEQEKMEALPSGGSPTASASFLSYGRAYQSYENSARKWAGDDRMDAISELSRSESPSSVANRVRFGPCHLSWATAYVMSLFSKDIKDWPKATKKSETEAGSCSR